jgi:hypothetical protein
MCIALFDCVQFIYFVLFLHKNVSVFPWQNMLHTTPAERQPQRRLSHLPAHSHVVSRLRGKGFMHLDGSSVPKCSSHPCFNGLSLASRSLAAAVASSWQALCTRKAPRLMWPLISLLVGGITSIPPLAPM